MPEDNVEACVPRQMLGKLHGANRDKKSVLSIIDGVKDDLRRVSAKLDSINRRMLDEHLELAAAMERELKHVDDSEQTTHPMPEVDPCIKLVNDNTPQISCMQIELPICSFANNMTRVATLQFMQSVGQARMKSLDVEDGHYSLSHEPDNNETARKKLIKINS